MASIAAETTPETVTKAIRPGGKPPKITRDVIDRVIERRLTGVSVAVAVGMEYPPIPLEHWNKTIERVAVLRAYLSQKEGECIRTILLRMADAGPGQWQKQAWLLERQFGYAAPKSGTGTTVNVQVNTCIGLAEDIGKRAAGLISQGKKQVGHVVSDPAKGPGK